MGTEGQKGLHMQREGMSRMHVNAIGSVFIHSLFLVWECFSRSAFEELNRIFLNKSLERLT